MSKDKSKAQPPVAAAGGTNAPAPAAGDRWKNCERIEHKGTTYVLGFPNVAPAYTAEEYTAFRDAVKERGQILVPLVVHDAPDACVLIDGIHRLRVAKELGLDVVVDWVSNLTPEQMRARALELNYHRRHLTQAQKEDRIKTELSAAPGRSDHVIAGLLGVSHVTVGKYRKELETAGAIQKTPTRQDGKGNARPSAVPRSPKRAPAAPAARTEAPRSVEAAAGVPAVEPDTVAPRSPASGTAVPVEGASAGGAPTEIEGALEDATRAAEAAATAVEHLLPLLSSDYCLVPGAWDTARSVGTALQTAAGKVFAALDAAGATGNERAD